MNLISLPRARLNSFQSAPRTSRETWKDPHLGKFVQLWESGESFVHFSYKVPEVNYTLAANCLLFEHWVVVPPTYQNLVLNDLYAEHVGFVKRKGMACSFFFRPGIDAD